ncbi:MAG: hypothetical protein ACD_13C00144G0011 [uncultured bacterium]|uniref:DUF2304 domain-containing protein n=1 Tax=Candidatus Woesebacteria bacterium GW2011_GWA1_40_43 TaxID=1618553 RepID=A0A0G0VIB8_9BACT|nr:MAG: hypothetical protein ACD_13C00144G0011 [uncultured bacterium]KKR53897.1 MAG: hypothetical protein UT88_C0005G0005 [Candidatus Woesebacteria bacterium GW2011_GWD2_40_19]KKR58614.1 MAG: hypothetical protein UT96_C0002G0017 [Candidatus Woesebacteria bacterium GW2011_GWC2_40_30]KKR62492.1 MAG: hypothetical protein UU02_C0045G0002 [Candidatus Woesebacteria bacterium GW2011_GWA1_40_43]HAU65305.1 hypothetical protein [Candidatus Woesebacteria bacterium]
MIIGLQIIALIFAFSMVYFVVLHFKRGEISKSEIVSWIIMWAAAIVIIVFPELLRKFASTFLVTRVFDLMVIAGFILVISLVTSSYIRTKKLEKKLEDMVRREALKKSK